MKTCLLALTLLATTAFADDLTALKPEQPNCARVLLHLASGERLIDYPNVVKIYTCEPQFISFETIDGYVISHRGTYTLLEQKNGTSVRSNVVPGQRFFDPK
jgi:hypothetical protein